MASPSAFLVVGHKQWGKSRTIRALRKKRGWVTIGGQDFFVRRMSNDDPPEKGYEDFIAGLDPREKPYVLIAYCPEEGSPRLLRALTAKYRVYAFILDHSYTDDRRISANEVAGLRQYARIEVFTPVGQPATDRARALERFITASLKKAAA
jgi:hypothetical protein